MPQHPRPPGPAEPPGPHHRDGNTPPEDRPGRHTEPTYRPGPPRRLLMAALDAAGRGWPVFPLIPYGKRPAVKAWPHVATVDPDLLTTWWRRAPYNIGIACGPAGLLVLDLDQPHPAPTPDADGGPATDDEVEHGAGTPAAGPIQVPGEWAATTVRHGRDVLAHLASRAGHPDPRDTYTVTTPRGEQRYFTVPPTTATAAPPVPYPDPEAQERIHRSGRNTAGTLGWLIDTRAAGGYVVAAGSVRRLDGELRHYRRTSPTRTAPAPAPQWLLDALLPPRPDAATSGSRPALHRAGAYARAALTDEAAAVREAPPGTRNTRLFIAAVHLGQLAAAGLLHDNDVTTALLRAADVHIGVDRFTETEARTAIANGLTYGRRRPRHLAHGSGPRITAA